MFGRYNQNGTSSYVEDSLQAFRQPILELKEECNALASGYYRLVLRAGVWFADVNDVLPWQIHSSLI
ncbi:hypothetical protein DRN98_09635 [Methanosarcinales archaeon]|nr:MAG: hypothetical protein DRN98_09635 [Methanosarcinales archaeon]